MLLRKTRALRKAAKFIAPFEGFRSTMYHDAVGVPTIGYGTTDPRYARPGVRLSVAQALGLLRRDCKPVMRAALEAASWRLSVNQLAALISFGYNLGPGYFDRGHSLGDALHSGRRKAAANAILLYDQAGGQKLPGLTRRRIAERRLFLRK